MRTPVKLGVNVDHVATIRQARGTRYPDPVALALAAEAAGADGITMHLREDRRHINDADIERMAAATRSKLNLEMAATAEMRDIALRVRPADACIVPERRAELTTEGGLDVAAQLPRIRDLTAALTAAGIRVSLFIDPDRAQVDAAAAAGAPVVELHTGKYADAGGGDGVGDGIGADDAVGDDGVGDGAGGDGDGDGDDVGVGGVGIGDAVKKELNAITAAANHAAAAGLIVNAGHGLHYANTAAVAGIKVIHELNIGHAIVARAFAVGINAAVGEMKTLIVAARGGEL